MGISRPAIRCLLGGWLFCFWITPIQALEVVVEGRAMVRGGDVPQARERAMRSALARAAESRAATVNAKSIVRPDAILEVAQVSASACTKNAQIVSEAVANNEITVTVRVTLDEAGDCQATCQSSYINRLVVTGFPLEFPEQLLPGEGYLPFPTAVAIARKLTQRGRLLVNHDGGAFPYQSPTTAPEPYFRTGDKETLFATLAKKHRGQYVLAGVYRDFGLRQKQLWTSWITETRHMEIEAFVHDGATGALLARRRFSAEAEGWVRLINKPSIGSAAFYETDLGRTWGALLDEIAHWAEDRVACLPFMARVLKTENHLLYLDAGAEAQLSVEDTLYLHTWQEAPVRAMTQLPLGQEKKVRGTVRLKNVYPKFSIAEPVEAITGSEVRPGDLFYAQ